MKRIISIFCVFTILVSIFAIVSADTEQIKYFFIEKCEEVQFKITFKEGNARGVMALQDPLRNPYTSASAEYKKNPTSFIYTVKRPNLGKWMLDIYGYSFDDVDFEIIYKNKEGHEYDERFGMPYISSPVDNNMRKYYIMLDEYSETIQKNINKSFSDVTSNHWATPCISKLSYLGIINGRGGKFYPEDNTKVNEFLKMMVVTMGYELPMNLTNWSKPYVDKAKELKLIDDKEYTDYNVPITREQAAKILVRATGLKEDLPDNNLILKIKNDIKDHRKIDGYKLHDVCTSYAVGLITGIDGYFKPQDNLTRAQASTVIMRYIDRDLRQPYVPVELRTVKTVTLPNNQGEFVKVYPGQYPEAIEAAIKLDEARKLSKGANDIRFLGYHEEITSWFYKDVESKLRGTCTKSNADIELLNMSIDIYTLNYNYTNRSIYTIDISDIEDTKNTHMDTILEMFKFWFKDEYKEPYEKLVQFMNTNNNGKYISYEKKYNSKTFFISKSGGIAVRIYAQ